MKVEDTISTPQRLREENGEVRETVVENGKEAERNEESSLICDYFMHSAIEIERRFLDKERVKWIASRMGMMTKLEETKERFNDKMGVEYRVNDQAVQKKPPTKSPEEIEQLLCWEQYFMELLLLCEVTEWEGIFWKSFKAFLDRIGNDRVEGQMLEETQYPDARSSEKVGRRRQRQELVCRNLRRSVQQMVDIIHQPGI